MKGIELLKHYFTSEVNGKFIINTCNSGGFLPISSECNRHFHQEIRCIMDACDFLQGSFYWSATPEGNDYWFNLLHPITMEITRNGLPMKLKTISPRYNIKPLKFE